MNMALRNFTTLIFAALTFTSIASANSARGGNLGIGAIIGSPTGLSANYFLSRDVSIDAGLAFDFDDYVLIFGDYLMHYPGAFGNKEQFFTELNPYIGVGPVLVIDTDDNRGRDDKYFDEADDDFGVGVRIPLGVEWMAPKFPLGISLEIVPGLLVIPSTDFFIQGGAAFRYYFK